MITGAGQGYRAKAATSVTSRPNGWEFRRGQLDDADQARIPTRMFSTVPNLQ